MIQCLAVIGMLLLAGDSVASAHFSGRIFFTEEQRLQLEQGMHTAHTSDDDVASDEGTIRADSPGILGMLAVPGGGIRLWADSDSIDSRWQFSSVDSNCLRVIAQEHTPACVLPGPALRVVVPAGVGRK